MVRDWAGRSGCWSDVAEGFAQEVFGGYVAQVWVLAELAEDGARFAFAEAEVAEGAEDLGVGVYRIGAHGFAVGCAVGVPERQGFGGSFDDELAAVGGAVMGSAQGDQVFDGVLAALGAGLEVVHIDEAGVLATGDAATLAIAGDDGSA